MEIHNDKGYKKGVMGMLDRKKVSKTGMKHVQTCFNQNTIITII